MYDELKLAFKIFYSFFSFSVLIVLSLLVLTSIYGSEFNKFKNNNLIIIIIMIILSVIIFILSIVNFFNLNYILLFVNAFFIILMFAIVSYLNYLTQDIDFSKNIPSILLIFLLFLMSGCIITLIVLNATGSDQLDDYRNKIIETDKKMKEYFYNTRQNKNKRSGNLSKEEEIRRVIEFEERRKQYNRRYGLASTQDMMLRFNNDNNKRFGKLSMEEEQRRVNEFQERKNNTTG